jgi:hypothetical protein
MASFEDRYSPSYTAGASNQADSNRLTAGLYRQSHQIRNDMRIANEFPSMGTAYGSHEGSQSVSPNKTFADRLDQSLEGQIEDRR